MGFDPGNVQPVVSRYNDCAIYTGKLFTQLCNQYNGDKTCPKCQTPTQVLIVLTR